MGNVPNENQEIDFPVEQSYRRKAEREGRGEGERVGERPVAKPPLKPSGDKRKEPSYGAGTRVDIRKKRGKRDCDGVPHIEGYPGRRHEREVDQRRKSDMGGGSQLQSARRISPLVRGSTPPPSLPIPAL